MVSRLAKGSKINGQKYGVGENVFIRKDLGSMKSHFRSGEEASILYTYGQIYGRCIESSYGPKSYFVEFGDGQTSGWYEEDELEPAHNIWNKIKMLFTF